MYLAVCCVGVSREGQEKGMDLSIPVRTTGVSFRCSGPNLQMLLFSLGLLISSLTRSPGNCKEYSLQNKCLKLGKITLAVLRCDIHQGINNCDALRVCPFLCCLSPVIYLDCSRAIGVVVVEHAFKQVAELGP